MDTSLSISEPLPCRVNAWAKERFPIDHAVVGFPRLLERRGDGAVVRLDGLGAANEWLEHTP